MLRQQLTKRSLIETNVSEALYFGISSIIKNIYYEQKERPNIFTAKDSIIPLLNRLAYIDRSLFDTVSKYEEMEKIQETNIASLEEKLSLKPKETIKELFATNQKALFRIVVNDIRKYVINKDMKFSYVLEKVLCKKIYKKIIISSFYSIVELYSNLDFISFNELEEVDPSILKEEALCIRVKCLDVFQQNILLSAILLRNNIINNNMFDKLCLAINSWFISLNDNSANLTKTNALILEKEKYMLMCTLAKYFEILTVNLGISERVYKIMPDYVSQKAFVNKHTPTMRFML